MITKERGAEVKWRKKRTKAGDNDEEERKWGRNEGKEKKHKKGKMERKNMKGILFSVDKK